METDSTEKKKKKRKVDIRDLFGVILVLVAIVLLIVFLIKGQTTVTGGFPENESVVSLTCGSTTIKYPLFVENSKPTKTLLEIKVISNKDKIDTIGLNYQLYYNTEEAIRESRDWNHFEMNKSFDEAGLEPDALGAMYSKLDDNFKFSLFAKADELNEKTAKYFMLDEKSDFKYNTAMKAYKAKGFICSENNKE